MTYLRRRPREVEQHDPRTFRLSKHFVLSDFLGCHSVYSKGFANPFIFDRQSDAKLENAMALCEHALEPIMDQFGPLSVSYGYISPELSRRVVSYQDPDIPSHHRWDLGAAADICVHKWVHGDFRTLVDLYAPESALGSPIALAHGFDYLDIPYSRMITYSESPFICMAVSAQEVGRSQPRKAFYENRYMGKPKAKPDYRQYASFVAKQRAFEKLQNEGLGHPWEGCGHPTYHGGGICQYQHRRVSKYTMVSDWLFDLKSISSGTKNIPSLNLEEVQDSFAAAGIVYDWLVDNLGVNRISIIEGYLSHLSPHFNEDNDWRRENIGFIVSLPDTMLANPEDPEGVEFFDYSDDLLGVKVNVETVLQPGWGK